MRVVPEKMEHLLVTCGGFERDWWVPMDEVSRIAGTREWLEEYGRVCNEDMVALLLGRVCREWRGGKGMEGVSERVMEEVRKYVMYWIEKWWQKRNETGQSNIAGCF